MALVKPQVFIFDAATCALALAALRAHWSGVNSAHFEIDPDVTGQSDDGFVVRSKVDLDDQYAWHRISATTGTVINDPTGSITAAGAYQSAPTGAHASKSSPSLSNFTYSSTTKLMLIEFPRRFYVVSLSSSGGINGTPMFWHGYGRCGLPKNALVVAGLGSQGRLMGDLLTLTNTRLQVADNGNQAENWIAPTEFVYAPLNGGATAPTASKIGAGYAFQAVVWGNSLTKQALVEAQDLVRTGQNRVWPAREGSQDGEHTYLYLKSTSDSLALYFDAAAALPTF